MPPREWSRSMSMIVGAAAVASGALAAVCIHLGLGWLRGEQMGLVITVCLLALPAAAVTRWLGSAGP